MDTPLSLEQADNAFVRLLLERANYETELYDIKLYNSRVREEPVKNLAKQYYE